MTPDEVMRWIAGHEKAWREGDAAVVRVLVRYGDPVRQEYLDLWVIRFADDGRVDDFEEWAYWPGKPYSS